MLARAEEWLTLFWMVVGPALGTGLIMMIPGFIVGLFPALIVGGFVFSRKGGNFKKALIPIIIVELIFMVLGFIYGIYLFYHPYVGN